MNRFLKSALHKGMPLNAPGVAEAITRATEALSNLDCEPGTVRWHGNTPVIYPGPAAASDPKVMEVRIAPVGGVNRVQVYCGENSQPLWSYHDEQVTGTGNVEDAAGWYRVADNANDGTVWAKLVDDEGYTVDFERELTGDYDDAVPIAIVAGGRVYQVRTGTIKEALIDNASINRNTDSKAQVYAFETAAETLPAFESSSALIPYKGSAVNLQWAKITTMVGGLSAGDWSGLGQFTDAIGTWFTESGTWRNLADTDGEPTSAPAGRIPITTGGVDAKLKLSTESYAVTEILAVDPTDGLTYQYEVLARKVAPT